MLLRRISRNGGVARLAQLASVKAPASSWKLPITVSDRRIHEVDRRAAARPVR